MYAFKDYDILLPYTLISELVNLVSSKNEVSRAARAARRVIYEIINSKNEGVRNGSFTQYSLGKGKGNLLIGDMNAFTLPKGMSANDVYSHKENDHVFIDICQKISFLQKSENLSKRYQADRAIALLYKEIRLVTNDQGMLIKAQPLNIQAEEYKALKVESEKLPKGFTALDEIPNIPKSFNGEVSRKEIGIPTKKIIPSNNFYYAENTSSHFIFGNGKQAIGFRSVAISKLSAAGIQPKHGDIFQGMALDALLNPKASLVTITGHAGTGKTLLSLAVALQSVANKTHTKIIGARPVVGIGEGHGFLPGDLQEKIAPYMAPFHDNIHAIKNALSNTDPLMKKIAQGLDKTNQHNWFNTGIIEFISIHFIRGRTFNNTFIIIDEAQNLTPAEVKAIITRAGEGTKIILCGDIEQIDTPYLNKDNNGLSYVITKMKDEDDFIHIHLPHGQRSSLANKASMLL
ncbi:MAG: PhoH family protein [Candidatus Pacebacteria bacterium]|nr:PhoH family protein [Candidatus Paceibacterota bacterium]